MRKNIFKTALFIILTFTCLSCKDDYKTTIPNPTVNFRIYLSSFDQDLQAVGRHKTFSQYGYMGVIVYHSGIDEFVAFDIACPADYYLYSYMSNCAIDYNGDKHNMECKCCGNEYSLVNGSAYKGNNYKYALRKYKVTRDPSSTTEEIYVVTNE